MSEVIGISWVGQPQVSVQLTPGQPEMRAGGGHTGNTRASREAWLSPVGSVSGVKNIFDLYKIGKISKIPHISIIFLGCFWLCTPFILMLKWLMILYIAFLQIKMLFFSIFCRLIFCNMWHTWHGLTHDQITFLANVGPWPMSRSQFMLVRTRDKGGRGVRPDNFVKYAED